MKKTLDTANATRLAWLAALVAVEAPARVSSYANAARIPWYLVTEIREELAAVGFDWKRAAIERKRITDQQRRAAVARRYGTNNPPHP
jgi:hypothetical protein